MPNPLNFGIESSVCVAAHSKRYFEQQPSRSVLKDSIKRRNWSNNKLFLDIEQQISTLLST